ncbi:MAG: ABC transporter ATP-binding protein [Candidatus Bathyarchaeia archaeon]
MVSVVLDHVTKRFGKVLAANDLCFEVKDKEFFVLLGPSGGGKSTILNLVAGLEKPDKGKIYFDDDDVTYLPPEKRNVAMVFQTYALYPHMKVFDNIATPLKVMKLPKEEIRRKVKEAAEMLRIDHLLDRMPYEISGGERQRVALARAIVRSPKIFLLDEPLSNIDAKLRVYARAELFKLQRKLGVTTLYVTHDQAEAMSMGDRIAVINQGNLIQIASPEELYHKPIDTFVGGFVGSPPMNFINAIYRDKSLIIGNRYRLTISQDVLGIIEELSLNEILLGVRPEHINISFDKTGVEDMEAEIYAIEYLGNETIVDLYNKEIGEDKIIKARIPWRFKDDVGKKVWMRFDKNNLYYFDGASQKNIFYMHEQAK